MGEGEGQAPLVKAEFKVQSPEVEACAVRHSSRHGQEASVQGLAQKCQPLPGP